MTTSTTRLWVLVTILVNRQVNLLGALRTIYPSRMGKAADVFPDWYQFMGKRTTGGLRRAGNPREGIHDREVPKYTQIGNAVPVKLAEVIGKHFKKILE